MKTNDLLKKIESKFDAWLEKFEERPISTGIKVIVVVIILKWIWKSFVGGDE